MGPHRRWGGAVSAVNSKRSGEFPQDGLGLSEDCNKRVPIRACPDGRMREAAKMLEFELVAALRDQIIELRGK